MNNPLPTLNANANFLNLGIGLSKKRMLNMKHTADPAMQTRKATKRSHLDRPRKDSVPVDVG